MNILRAHLRIFALAALLCISQESKGEKVFDRTGLEQILKNNPKTGKPVESINELLPLLPEELRENFLFVYDSRSPFRESISPQFPRIILFTKDTRLILTFTGDPSKPGYDFLESMQFDEETASFQLKTYLMPAAEKRSVNISTDTKSCAQCHGEDTRPINDSYPLWPGFYGSIQDTFPSNLEIGKIEKEKYKHFLQTEAKNGLYKHLIFPKGSSVSPFLDPKLFSQKTVEADLNSFKFLPNTRFGMALTELNRKRIYRKLKTSKKFSENEREYLSELLGCEPSSVSPKEIYKIENKIKKENRARLIRLGANPDDPSQRINDMQELKFAEPLAQLDWISRQSGVSRADWSMALESDSLAFFDGILSGIHAGKNYYIKEDIIFTILESLSKKDPKFKPFFKTSGAYKQYGYPFGLKIDLTEALKSCPLLIAPMD